MSYHFHLPDIGEGLEEAEIVEWLVAVGDTVARDQALVEVLTDKASSELPSPTAGVVVALGGDEGDRLRVGDLLIEIDDGSAGDADPPRSEATAPPESMPAEPAEASAESHSASRASRPKASPATRRRARELGIDLAGITGTGPGGRILDGDLDAARASAASRTGATAVPAAPSTTAPRGDAPQLGQLPAGRHPLRGVRGVIARNMAQSWSEIPHIHSLDELDASLLLDLRTRMEGMGRPVTPLAVAVVAAARALRAFPQVNACVEGSAEGDEMLVHERVNIGLAVATDGGLVVPVLHDADGLDVFSATTAIEGLAARARTGDLGTADLTGGTFTITNYGSLGGRWATPIIPPGQAAILGMGRIADRPVAVDGSVEVRPLLPYAFGADHRIVDGDLLEAFKRSIVEDLAEPLRLLVDP